MAPTEGLEPAVPANAFYAQSGGVTAVINASACGVIETVRKHPGRIGTLYAGRNGILGALREDLIDAGAESAAAVAALKWTPGGAFGSCRYKLKPPQEDMREYERLIAVFKAHDIRFFFYNGGGDSQDTAHKVSQIGGELGHPVACIGIPKTVDNDLPHTDCCPGFGSVAKYVAVSVREAALDVASMCETSTKVFILEVMGRHTGWIAAAAGLAKRRPEDAPHIVLLPEVPFEAERFLAAVRAAVSRFGYCVVVAAEGIRDAEGNFLAESGGADAFGHAQLGGVAPRLAALVREREGFKFHWAVADYLQRSARHVASATDVEQAYAVGRHSVELAVDGASGVMATIVRHQDEPYDWTVGEVPLSRVANRERRLPKAFIRGDGLGITAVARRYLQPLIRGEDSPPYLNGLPTFAELANRPVAKKLPPFAA